jgi:hypothetical protein
MRIIKFIDFIKENLNDTPEDYIEQALRNILDKIMEMFPDDNQEDSEDEIISFSDARQRGDEKEAASKKIKFSDYGTKLMDQDLSRESGILTITIEEDEAWYKIYFMIDIKDAVPTADEDFESSDIKDCKVKFVKYNNGDKIERKISKTLAIDDIDEEKLIELKIEVDGDKVEGLGIETDKEEDKREE